MQGTLFLPPTEEMTLVSPETLQEVERISINACRLVQAGGRDLEFEKLLPEPV